MSPESISRDEASLTPLHVLGPARASVEDPTPSATVLRAPAVRGAVIACGALFVVAFLRFGWLADDAFIAIRSVDHLVHGLGFSLNVGERVQSFTSPLWALFCVPFFAATRNPYAALMVPSVLCSLGLAVVLARGFSERPGRAAVVLLALTASPGFLSFSTSGLENPLAHLLAAAFCFERLRKDAEPTYLGFLLGAGLVLTRLDYALLCAPALLLSVASHPKKSIRVALPALGVVASWLLFATFYYGFPFPNTAYAKLNTHIELSARMLQGLAYLVDSVSRDPLVLVLIGSSLLVVIQTKASRAARALLAGVACYLAYVVSIGGDFMSGRFLTVCYLVSVVVLVGVVDSFHPRALAIMAVGAVPFAVTSFQDRKADHTVIDCSAGKVGISDERQCYVENTGLSQNLRVQKWKDHGYLREFRQFLSNNRERVVVWNLVGMVGYATKRKVHIVENFALSEPLLARIRITPEGDWRPGHFFRQLPEGYVESLRTGQNVVKDPCLHALYDDIALATHAPLFDRRRWGALWRLNTRPSTCEPPAQKQR